VLEVTKYWNDEYGAVIRGPLLPEFAFGSSRSNLNLVIIFGSLYVHAPSTLTICPSKQAVHARMLLEPIIFEYPVVQLVHTETPDVLEYVPMGQPVHVIEELAPSTFEYAPTEQFVHALALV